MATFARPAFSAKTYAAFRPAYPPSLFRTVLQYHQANGSASTSSSNKQQQLLLDLGCGHGLIARALKPHFQSVLAIDPSAGMIAQAQQTTTDPSIEFRQGSAEDLGFLSDASVDLAVAGQAAHWFDYSKVWPNLARVVRTGGTIAFWGYKDNVMMGAEQATAIMEDLVYGFGEAAPGIQKMGPYWEQPGRNILRDLLRSVQPPAQDWRDVAKHEHEPGEDGPEEDVWLRKKMKLGEVEGYLRTFSCYSSWREAHPQVKSRADGGDGDGDILDVMWDRMIDSVPEWKAAGDRWREVEVVNDWGTYILLARRK